MEREMKGGLGWGLVMVWYLFFTFLYNLQIISVTMWLIVLISYLSLDASILIFLEIANDVKKIKNRA